MAVDAGVPIVRAEERRVESFGRLEIVRAGEDVVWLVRILLVHSLQSQPGEPRGGVWRLNVADRWPEGQRWLSDAVRS